jgi:HK97 gp10 family phage protein
MSDYDRYADDDDYVVPLTTMEESLLGEFESLGDATSIRDEFESVTGKYPWEKGVDRSVKSWLKQWEREGYIAAGQATRWREFKKLWEEACSDPDAVRKALKESVTKIRDAAKAMAPVDESAEGPHMKQNIRARARKGRKTDDYVATAEVGVFNNKKNKMAYSIATWQEYGTTRHSAQPFLEPALDKYEVEVIGKFHERLLEQYFKKLR